MVQSLDKSHNIDKASALPGRTTPMPVATLNEVTGHSMTFVPEGMATAIFGMGCFWALNACFGSSRGFIALPQVTAVAIRKIQPIAKYAAARLGMPKWYV